MSLYSSPLPGEEWVAAQLHWMGERTWLFALMQDGKFPQVQERPSPALREEFLVESVERIKTCQKEKLLEKGN